jgi:hypothetical protein
MNGGITVTKPEFTFTNEERNLEIYKNGSIPTNPSEVNSDTSLDTLNLNWTERELPERTRTKHVNRLHPYLGKYIPQLVEIFLRKYFKKDDWVFDPFCGSGTTLVQANELGINSIGFDISEFNVMLCKVKTSSYDINLLQKEADDLLKRVKSYTINTNDTDLFSELVDYSKIELTENEYLKKWFAPQALKELLIFRDFLKDYQYKNVFKIILSRSARSSRLTTHFDLDFPKKPVTEPYECFKHGRICKPTSEAFKFLKRYTIDTVTRIKEYSKIKTDAIVDVIHADSRYAKLRQIDGIITSPPYVGLIDYHEQHNYAYNLFELIDNSDKEIGAAKKGSSTKSKADYQEAMAMVLQNSAKYVKENGKIIVVAGDKNDLYPEIGKMANLKLTDKLERHLNRRTGRRSTEFFETVFIYTK